MENTNKIKSLTEVQTETEANIRGLKYQIDNIFSNKMTEIEFYKRVNALTIYETQTNLLAEIIRLEKTLDQKESQDDNLIELSKRILISIDSEKSGVPENVNELKLNINNFLNSFDSILTR